MKSKGNMPMYYGAKPILFQFANEMRKHPTPAERTLWKILNSEFFELYKFRRQHPIARFIADFYCHHLKLVIEVDGDYHSETGQQEYDTFRDSDMHEFSISVMRFQNEDVLNNESYVKEEIAIRIRNLMSRNLPS